MNCPRSLRRLTTAAVLLLSIKTGSVHAAVPQADYHWLNVAMGGGGAVPGVVVHPRVPNLAYIHTDVGGCYRWDDSTHRWIPLLDSIRFPEWNLYGVDSLAVDPTDPTGNIVYISTGKYVEDWVKPLGMIMKSTDRGAHWTRLPLSPTGGSNQDQGCAERLAVDPANGQHVLYAARSGGLSCSWDGGASWSHVKTAPTGGQANAPDRARRGNGLAFTLFDPSSGTLDNPRRTRVIYIGASNDGVYRSDDGGMSWRKLQGSPPSQHRAVVGSDGTVVVSSDQGVAKFQNNAWTQINPPGKPGTTAIGIDPTNPQHILATVGYSHYAGVFASTDGGKTWRDIRGKRNPTVAWWPQWHWFSAPDSFAFDPFDPRKVWATDWYGAYHTDDVNAPTVTWTNLVAGDEEICAIGALLCPRVGPYRLLSGAADVGGMDHERLDQAPPVNIWGKNIPGGMARTGIAESLADPNFFASVFTRDWSGPGTGAYSLDAARTWKLFPKLPVEGIKGGRVAIAGARHRILWLPQKYAPFYTDDLGQSWHPVRSDMDLSGAAEGDGIFSYDQPVAVDGGDPDRVYLLHRGKLLASTDAGATFATVNPHVATDGTPKLATSDRTGDLWIAAGGKGLLHSTDGGKTFTNVRAVHSANLVALGKRRDSTSPATLFIQGWIGGVPGYFRSSDNGASWIEVDMPLERVGNEVNTMTADWNHFGGMFIGSGGRGFFYGAPAAQSNTQ